MTTVDGFVIDPSVKSGGIAVPKKGFAAAGLEDAVLKLAEE